MIHFLGVGAQKAGTSWLYACLYEHPEICAPLKEIHFFSRPRFEKGKDWYERHFSRCKSGTVVGEFSTSYLFSAEAPERIAAWYPSVKLIAVLRNPLTRAYSQYRNALKAGEVPTTMTFASYAKTEPSCLEQGRYAAQLARYDEHFDQSQLLVLIYEDIAKDPLAFVQRVYAHLGVDATFVPPSLSARINIARVPKYIWLDWCMHRSAEVLRRVGLDRAVHVVKRSGVTDALRKLNTRSKGRSEEYLDVDTYAPYFRADVAKVSARLGRDLWAEWNI